MSATEDYWNVVGDNYERRIADLEAEIARLRNALVEARSSFHLAMLNDRTDFFALRDARNAVHDALSVSDGSPEGGETGTGSITK